MLRGKSDALRIIDANLNRALEALRVLEEAARFVLDSTHLSSQTKHLRHRLSAAVQPFASALPYARRIEEDVGTGISTPSERTRESTAEVMRANASRLKESLRVLEEYAKILDAGTGESLQAIRYESYALERSLLYAFSPRTRVSDALLIAIVSTSDPRGALETARMAMEGGADVIQLREKGISDRLLFETALELRRITAGNDAVFIVNDRADAASACGADGVHVGREDLPVKEVRRLLGPEAVVGASAHSAQEGTAAQEQGADYLGVGSFLATTTKGDAVVRGPECFLEVRKAVDIPCFAVGGITADNVDEAVKAGVERVAVASGIAQSADPREAARRIKTSLLSARADGSQNG
jgi:thiamine-phosphate pyrophosphorylase